LEELTAYFTVAISWEVSPFASEIAAGTKSTTSNGGITGIKWSGDHTETHGREREKESKIPYDNGDGGG
jgi:hypothetical protein